MAHVYEGQPDGRQSADQIPVSRFRPKYRALSDEEKSLHDAIKGKAAELEELFEKARILREPPLAESSADTEQHVFTACAAIGPDYFSEGMKSLELAVMWTVKGLTS